MHFVFTSYVGPSLLFLRFDHVPWSSSREGMDTFANSEYCQNLSRFLVGKGESAVIFR